MSRVNAGRIPFSSEKVMKVYHSFGTFGDEDVTTVCKDLAI